MREVRRAHCKMRVERREMNGAAGGNAVPEFARPLSAVSGSYCFSSVAYATIGLSL